MFNFSDLYGMYKLCGGNKLNANFFLNRIPGIMIEHGLVNIYGDLDVANMYALHKDSDLVIILIEETMADPQMVLAL